MAFKGNSLTTRQRRDWAKKLMEAQESVEEGVVARNKLMADALAAGMSYAAIESATGLGPQSVRNGINDPERADEGRKADS